MALFRLPKVYNERRDVTVHEYKRIFRFEKDSVKWIAHHFLGPKTGEKRGGALTKVQKMECFLRYCADPGYQSGVGEDMGLNHSTVSKNMHFVMNKISENANAWIKFPTTSREVEMAKRSWQDRFSFPLAFGAIDCTHIRIQRPASRFHPDEYVNRKGFHSINVQATCNADEIFTSVEAAWPGSVHDSRILHNSLLPQQLKLHDGILLGDSGYGITPNLMTPYASDTKCPREKAFNKLFTRERVVIERVFGQVKRRFPVLAHPVRIKLESTPKLIMSCFVLHNVSKHLGDAEGGWHDTEDIEEESDDVSHEPRGQEERARATIRRLGQNKRNTLAEIIFHRELNDL